MLSPGDDEAVTPDEGDTLILAEDETAQVRRPPRGATEDSPRPPAWIVGAISGSVYLLFLSLINHGLIRSSVFEDGDFAANSILIDRAIQGRLFIGNYSRVGFNHPGPAILDAQAFGEVVFHRLLPIAPTPYGGQFMGILCLNALCVGLGAMILYRATHRPEAAAVLPVAALAVSAWSEFANASTWMPHTYIAPFILLVIAAASVATGRWKDLWVLVLAGGVLVHGHVSFVLFTGVTAAVAIASGWYLTRRWGLQTPRLRRDLIAAGGVGALLVAPMVANLVLHWPGEFQKYADYTSDKSGFVPRGPRDVLDFVFRYWTGGSVWWSLALVIAFGVTVATWRWQRRELRVLLGGLAGIVVLEAVLLAVYAYKGVDELGQVYIGFFGYSGPVWVLTAGIVSGLCVLRGTVARVGGCVALVAIAGVIVSSSHLANGYRGDPGVPVLADAVQDAPLVRVDFATPGWPAAVGLVENLRRRDVPVCVVNPVWDFLVTPQLICDDDPPSGASTVVVFGPGETPVGPVIAVDGDVTVTAG